MANLLSITVTPTGVSSALGTTRQFTATGTLSNNGTQDLTTWATWSSSDESVALIGNSGTSKGLATTVAEGSTIISASFNDVTGSTSFIVTSAVITSIEVTPANAAVPLGATSQFAAVGTFSDSSMQDVTSLATWTSTNIGVATVSNETGSRGLVKTLSQGTTTIQAVFGTITSSTTLTVTAPQLVSIVITPSNPSVVVGFLQQFSATGILSDGSTEDLTASATWESSNPFVATVSDVVGSKGLAVPRTAGTTTVTATVEGRSGSTILTVVFL